MTHRFEEGFKVIGIPVCSSEVHRLADQDLVLLVAVLFPAVRNVQAFVGWVHLADGQRAGMESATNEEALAGLCFASLDSSTRHRAP